MDKKLRIGVYGGTFDPIHRTHLAIARAALDHAQLDRVLFVVSAAPPHKQADVYAGPEDRFQMVQAALADEPRMEVSRLELDRKGLSFTADTLRELQAAHPGAELFLIVGYDALLDIPNWHHPREILSHARLLAAPRPGARLPVPRDLAGRYEMLPFTESEVSSTEIRARIAAGQDARDLLPPAVERLIREKSLYHEV